MPGQRSFLPDDWQDARPLPHRRKNWCRWHGEVYRAHDEQLDRDVALKVLPAGTLADEAARKQFRKEALALAKLNHPNIETVFEFNTQDGVDFLAMELIASSSLGEKLKAGPLQERENQKETSAQWLLNV